MRVCKSKKKFKASIKKAGKEKENLLKKGCSDRHSFVYYEVLYNNKSKGQTGHFADSIHASQAGIAQWLERRTRD